MSSMGLETSLSLIVSTERKIRKEPDGKTVLVPRIDVMLENRDPNLEAKIDNFLRDALSAGVTWEKIEERGWHWKIPAFRGYVPIPSAGFGEVLLFCNFALRQMANLGHRDTWAHALATELVQIADRDVLVLNALEGRTSGQRKIEGTGLTGMKEHRQYLSKSFEAELVFGTGRYTFVMRPRGFGFLAKGVGQHAVQATIGLARALTDQRIHDVEYAYRLSTAAGLCGSAFLSGTLTVKNQQQLALVIMDDVINRDPLNVESDPGLYDDSEIKVASSAEPKPTANPDSADQSELSATESAVESGYRSVPQREPDLSPAAWEDEYAETLEDDPDDDDIW